MVVQEKAEAMWSFQWGDVVQVFSSRHEALHQQLFFISYIDHHKMKMLHVETAASVELKLTYDVSAGAHVLLDESVEDIQVVSRSKESGFARSLGLLPDTYVDLEFGGDIPQFVTGKITHLHHDMIEITTIPTKSVLYIDFAYQGIPDHLPLRKIRIRDGPPKQSSLTTTEDEEGGVSSHPRLTFLQHADNDASVDWNLEGEMMILGNNDAESQSYHVLLEKEYLEADRLMAHVMPTETQHHPCNHSFVKDLLESNESYQHCERLRTLSSRSKTTDDDSPPKGWIPVWKPDVQGDDETTTESLTDGIITETNDIVRQSRRPQNILSWIVLPPHAVVSPRFLLEEMEAPRLFLWRLFAKENPPVRIDVSGHDFFQTVWPQTTSLSTTLSTHPAPLIAKPETPRIQQQQQQRAKKETEPVKVVVDTVSLLLEEQASVLEQFKSAYKNESSTSSTEKWQHMLQRDCAAYLSMLVRLLTIPHLTLSKEMTNTLTERMHKKIADFEDMNHVMKIKAGDCNQRILAKRYTSLDQVHKDSHHGEKTADPIYFDAEYDDTPYDLLKPLEQEFANTTAKPSEFEEFVAHNLIDRHNYVPKLAQEVAETMVNRKRRVKEGQFALLETQGALPFYYRRTHDDKWVLDKTVDATTFVDTPTLFCNMDKICMRDATTAVCQTPEDAQLRLRYLEQRRTLREMQTRLTQSAFQTAKQLEDEANRLRTSLKRRSILQYVDLHRFDEYHAALGHQRTMEDDALQRKESPHVALRNRILGDRDYVRRNQRILDFVVRHCREALGTESPHWWYCNETVPAFPLIPVMLHQLARAWTPRLLVNEAVIEDGCYVDPGTGYSLSFTEFVGENPKETVVDDDDDDSQDLKDEGIAKDILVTLCRNLQSGRRQAAADDDVERALSLARELVQEIHTASQYKHITTPRDGAPFLPFHIYHDRECILRTASAFLFAIQTSTQSSRRPPWKRALSVGYPLDPDEKHVQGLSVLSLLLNKLKSNKQQPWDSLNPWNEATIRHALVTRCRILLVQKPKYETLLHIQRRRQPPTIPTTTSVVTWPPLQSDVVRVTHSKQFSLLEDGFATHLGTLIAQANRKQHAALDALKSKSWIHAYGVVEDPHKSELWIEAARAWQRIAQNVDQRCRLQSLAMEPENQEQTRKQQEEHSTVRDRTAWSALIWYHQLNRPGPIPDPMRALGWIKEKPADYDCEKTLEENKAALSSSIKLDRSKFQAMMKVVFQQNVVAIPEAKHLFKKQVGAARDMLASMTRASKTPALGLAFCQLLDAHLLVGKNDEDTAFALMEEVTVQRMTLWTLIRSSFARDQVHRIQVLLREEPRNLNRIRNLCKVFPRLYADEIPELLRPAFGQVQQRVADMVVFLEAVTPHILDDAMVDAIYVYSFLVVLKEYLNQATNAYVSDWIANLLASWLVR